MRDAGPQRNTKVPKRGSPASQKAPIPMTCKGNCAADERTVEVSECQF